jgi:hypothetical protein
MNLHNDRVRSGLYRWASLAILIGALPSMLLAQAPFGNMDTPANNASNLAGAIPVTGWALSVNTVDHVWIYRNPLPGEATQSQPKKSVAIPLLISSGQHAPTIRLKVTGPSQP